MLILFCVSFTGWTTLDHRRRALMLNSVSQSTRQTRCKHWSCYIEFCKLYHLLPMPCSVRQAGNFLAFLAKYIKHSSIITYYQSVRFFHKLVGFNCPLLSHPELKTVLNGIVRQPGSASVPKPAFSLEDIKSLQAVICVQIDVHLLVWTSVLLLFRTLLRVSHVTDSPHCRRRVDVNFHDWGLVLSIHSSKTMRPGAKTIQLPVVASKSRKFCPVFWIRYLLSHHPLRSQDPLFATKKLPKLSYSMFNKYFKVLCSMAGLKQDFASHSLRRGGATFMSETGFSVAEVKDRGGWASDTVYKYINPSSKARRASDNKFSLSFDLGLVGE